LLIKTGLPWSCREQSISEWLQIAVPSIFYQAEEAA
jgi:hypothetical protein